MSILLIAGLAPIVVLPVLWVLYLSLAVAGQTFLEFQWDALLLETGLLACLYAPLGSRFEAARAPNPIVRWVLWSLAFKLTFLSGATKILSGDPTWANWTALTYHYETQPLPAWTSWYVHQLSDRVHYWSVPPMFAIELIAPFAIFLPSRFRRTRLAACGAMILLQLGIGATGNYGFFNLLSIVLYLALLDDQQLGWLSSPFRRSTIAGSPEAAAIRRQEAPTNEPAVWRVTASAIALVLALLSAVSLVREIEATAGVAAQIEGSWAGRALRSVAPFRSVNGYGLFRVMTTDRPEIVVEVSADARNWREYAFRWKPGSVTRRPAFVAPHMPRLDWQMWFAALDPEQAPWLDGLLRQILAGEPAVLGLVGPNPLGERPRFARLAYYDYRFTTTTERARTGAWWTRTFRGYLTGPMASP